MNEEKKGRTRDNIDAVCTAIVSAVLSGVISNFLSETAYRIIEKSEKEWLILSEGTNGVFSTIVFLIVFLIAWRILLHIWPRIVLFYNRNKSIKLKDKKISEKLESIQKNLIVIKKIKQRLRSKEKIEFGLIIKDVWNILNETVNDCFDLDENDEYKLKGDTLIRSKDHYSDICQSDEKISTYQIKLMLTAIKEIGEEMKTVSVDKLYDKDVNAIIKLATKALNALI